MPTVIVAEAIVGVGTCVPLMAAVLVSTVPAVNPVETVTGKVTVMRWLLLMVQPEASVGGAAPTMPGPLGSNVMGPTKFSPAGRVSEISALVTVKSVLVIMMVKVMV